MAHAAAAGRSISLTVGVAAAVGDEQAPAVRRDARRGRAAGVSQRAADPAGAQVDADDAVLAVERDPGRWRARAGTATPRARCRRARGPSRSKVFGIEDVDVALLLAAADDEPLAVGGERDVERRRADVDALRDRAGRAGRRAPGPARPRTRW